MRILSGAFFSCPLTNSQLKSGPWLGCFRVLMLFLSHSCSFGFVPGFIVLLGSKSSPLLLESCKVSFRILLFCCICWTLISLPGSDAEQHLYGMMLLPPWSTVRMVCFWCCSVCSLHTLCFSLMAKNLILISSDYRTFSSWIQSLPHAFMKTLAEMSYDIFNSVFLCTPFPWSCERCGTWVTVLHGPSHLFYWSL